MESSRRWRLSRIREVKRRWIMERLRLVGAELDRRPASFNSLVVCGAIVFCAAYVGLGPGGPSIVSPFPLFSLIIVLALGEYGRWERIVVATVFFLCFCLTIAAVAKIKPITLHWSIKMIIAAVIISNIIWIWLPLDMERHVEYITAMQATGVVLLIPEVFVSAFVCINYRKLSSTGVLFFYCWQFAWLSHSAFAYIGEVP